MLLGKRGLSPTGIIERKWRNRMVKDMTVEQIEKHNVETFEKYGIGYPSGENRHICTQCRKPVSIDGSMSSKGHKLICNGCVYRVFGGVTKAFEWIEGKIEIEEVLD